ncbi:DNA/RNA helicase domain-containing protein [Culicoidibacter larvae]|nr:DNA/RNA helicase domain-containing protein [Culicoidibacter larvae]
MSKNFDLDSLINANDSDNADLLQSFIKLIDNNYSYDGKNPIKPEEIAGLVSFAKKSKNIFSKVKREGYFMHSLIMHGVREEFDILRFSAKSVFNLELKSKLPKNGVEMIKGQMQRHSHLLSILSKRITVCTYITKTEQLFFLNTDNELELITFEELSKKIDEDFVNQNELENIDSTDLIISPYSQPKEFAEHNYFLTDEQKQIKTLILNDSANRIGITGGPGTGKSLLLFDIAVELKRIGYSCLIVFCGNLPEAEDITTHIGIDVIPIKRLTSAIIESKDVLLYDEAQRIYPLDFNVIQEIKGKKIILSVDNQQTLHISEKNRNIQKFIEDNSDYQIHTLKRKIRIDAEMSTFIKLLLNKSARNIQPAAFSKISVSYFENDEDAFAHIENKCHNEGYVSIELTEYETKSSRVIKCKHFFDDSFSTHDVVGREYKNVLVCLNRHYYYEETELSRGLLKYNNPDYYPHHEISCTFQALTRVKNKLHLVIIKNPEVFIKVQEILTMNKDKLNA